MNDRQIMIFIKYITIAGNIIYILWILYNGINEGFKGTWVQIFSYIGLIGLLAINSILLLRKSQNGTNANLNNHTQTKN